MTGNFDEWLEGLKSDLPTHCVQRPHGFRTAAERAIGLKKKDQRVPSFGFRSATGDLKEGGRRRTFGGVFRR